MGNIEWLEISELPEAFKDGRKVLLHYRFARSTIVCEGYWNERAGHFMTPHDPMPRVTHFAEINPPTIKAQSPETDGE